MLFTHIILREERLLHAFFPNKCAFLRVAKCHYLRPHKAKDKLLLTWSRLRTTTNASLDTMWAHNGIFGAHKGIIPLPWVTIHNVSREGRRIWNPLYKATMRWRMGDHIVMLARISQAIPVVCEPELKIEGTQLFSNQQVQSNIVEREGDCTEASLG